MNSTDKAKAKDIIYVDTTVHFSFMDRIRILFMGTALIKSAIYTLTPEVELLGTESITIVEPIFSSLKKEVEGLEQKVESSISTEKAKLEETIKSNVKTKIDNTIDKL